MGNEISTKNTIHTITLMKCKNCAWYTPANRTVFNKITLTKDVSISYIKNRDNSIRHII